MTSGATHHTSEAKLSRPTIPDGCHHDGIKLALTLCDGKKRVYGAQGHKITGLTVGHLDLIIDLAGLVKVRRFITSGSRRYVSLNSFAFPDVITLDWPDMSAPTHIRLRFWSQLLTALPAHTCIACMGSHGRTGTAMAALLIADGMSAERAMATVRDKHCARAIETAGQETYLKSLEKERDA